MAKAQGQQTGKQGARKIEFVFDGKRLENLKKSEIPQPRLRNFYKEHVIEALIKKFNYKNVMQVPKLEKITINIGVGDAVSDPKLLQSAINELELITGQRPVVTKAKTSISNFKLRKDMPIGCMVTLRSAIMYEFLDRFINIASPRIRDFRGLSDKSFDGRGNYSVGIKEQIIFPEIDVDKVARINGMDINFVTTAKTDEEAYALLSEFGFPFKKKD
ncbi:MAG: 50S ribosomal protein L5 [Chloroherpetonaceae bacterium]|jgi:large subunit ribosomal protein L5|nr:50S ribosomal protein L5 [bacterium]